MSQRPDSDLDVLNLARHRSIYQKSNSLVEWTLSPEWTKPLIGNVRGSVRLGECINGNRPATEA